MPQEPEDLLLGCQEGLVRIIHQPGSAGRESSFPKVEIGPSHPRFLKRQFWLPNLTESLPNWAKFRFPLTPDI